MLLGNNHSSHYTSKDLLRRCLKPQTSPKAWLLGVPNTDPHQVWLEDFGCLGKGAVFLLNHFQNETSFTCLSAKPQQPRKWRGPTPTEHRHGSKAKGQSHCAQFANYPSTSGRFSRSMVVLQNKMHFCQNGYTHHLLRGCIDLTKKMKEPPITRHHNSWKAAPACMAPSFDLCLSIWWQLGAMLVWGRVINHSLSTHVLAFKLCAPLWYPAWSRFLIFFPSDQLLVKWLGLLL